ncbi:MAG: hypothetical protein ACRCTI_14660 [Beijerinckiaceae bacterium]
MDIAPHFFTSAEVRRRILSRIFRRIGRKPGVRGDDPSTILNAAAACRPEKRMRAKGLAVASAKAMVDFSQPGRSKQP